MVKALSNRMTAKPTLRVMRRPLAITNSRSFFSRAMSIFSSDAAGA
jgi:hypothetical protein